MKHIVILLSLVCFTSCVLVPPQPASPQEQAVARTFTPPAGKALLYVYKRGGITTGYARRPVFVDGKLAGENGNGTFFSIPLKPGRHEIQAAAFLVLGDGSEKKEYPEISLTAQAGKTYFIRQAAEGSNGDPQSPTLIPVGGILVPMGGGRSPFSATLMDPVTGRADCLQLRQVAAQP